MLHPSMSVNCLMNTGADERVICDVMTIEGEHSREECWGRSMENQMREEDEYNP